MSGKSMPVDLDHVKPFMGFCTAFIYIYIIIYIEIIDTFFPTKCEYETFSPHRKVPGTETLVFAKPCEVNSDIIVVQAENTSGCKSLFENSNSYTPEV